MVESSHFPQRSQTQSLDPEDNLRPDTVTVLDYLMCSMQR